MSNTHFQFKQFRIDQSADGMKVTTDGCILGAMVSPVGKGRILDIGTGTGLLSLMMAQRTEAEIDAIEIHPEVMQQAAQNVSKSPWPNQISVLREDLKTFDAQTEYHQIVCNPPFFKGNQKGKSSTKNTAIHDDTLPMSLLVERSSELLTVGGSLWVMYPEYEMKRFEELAIAKGFSLGKQIMVYNKQSGPVFRVICEFQKGPVHPMPEHQLIIKGSDGTYTKDFSALLKDYYLHL